MADPAPPNHSVDTSKVEPASHADTPSASEALPGKGANTVRSDAQSQAEATNPISPGPALSQLRSSPANGLPAATHSLSLGVPPQKKFTHSNINKKFLEQTHPTSTPSQSLSASAVAKSGTSTRALSTVSVFRSSQFDMNS